VIGMGRATGRAPAGPAFEARASAGPGVRSRHREKNGILSPARTGTPVRRDAP
jgi:hypothetical protein